MNRLSGASLAGSLLTLLALVGGLGLGYHFSTSSVGAHRVWHTVLDLASFATNSPSAFVGHAFSSGLASAASASVSAADVGDVLGGLLIALVLSVVFVVAGTVVVMAWPRRVQLATATLSQAPWPVIGVGVLTGMLLPFVLAAISVVLAITIIGALLIPVVWLAAFGFWVYGAVTIGLWIGQRVAESGRVPVARQSLLVTTVLGLALFVVITFIPTAIIPPLGGFLVYMLGFIGTGAAILSRFGTTAPLRNMSQMLVTGAGRVTHRLGGQTSDPNERTRHIS